MTAIYYAAICSHKHPSDTLLSLTCHPKLEVEKDKRFTSWQLCMYTECYSYEKISYSYLNNSQWFVIRLDFDSSLFILIFLLLKIRNSLSNWHYILPICGVLFNARFKASVWCRLASTLTIWKHTQDCQRDEPQQGVTDLWFSEQFHELISIKCTVCWIYSSPNGWVWGCGVVWRWWVGACGWDLYTSMG